MAFITHVVAIQHWEGKAPWPSSVRWLKRALGAARKRDKTKPTKAISAPPRPRSDKALAEIAADHYFGIADEGARLAVVNRLREKFSGSYMRKQSKGHDVDYPSTYHYRAVEHDYVQESLEAEGLTRICEELREWGIPTKL